MTDTDHSTRPSDPDAPDALSADTVILDTLLRAQQQVMQAGGDVEASLRALVTAALGAVRTADGVVVEQREGDGLRFHLAVGTTAGAVGLRIGLDESLSGLALRTQETLLTADAQADPRTPPFLAQRLAMRSVIVVPLYRRGEPFGILKIHAAEPGMFGSRHVLIAQMLAGLISATYIEDAELTALRAAEATEQHYSHIIDSAIDSAIVSTDEAGLVTSWSRGAETIFGWREDQMLGEPIDRIYTPEDRRDGRPHEERRLAAENGRASDERWHVRADGTRFYAHGAVTPLEGGGGGYVKSLRNVTSEHVTREALASSRERLDVALDTGLIGFFDWDVANATVRGDERTAGFYGIDATRLAQGLPVAELGDNIHPADVPASRRSALQSATRAQDLLQSFRIVGGGGDTRWLLVRGRCIDQDGDTPLRYIGTVIDVTVQREAEERLRLSTERLELATRAAGLGSFDYMPRTGELDWDDRCRALFGLSPGVPVSYEGAFLGGLHPDDRARAAAAVAAALDPDGTGEFDVEYRTVGIEDGVERVVEARGLAFFDGREAVRLVGTVLDVSDSRREQARLRETEERLRLAGRATNDAIWDWDLARDHVVWNEALRTKYGHDLPGGLSDGGWWLDHIHPDDRARIDASIHAVIDGTGTDWADDYRFRRADGGYADLHDRGYVLRDAEGGAVRMLGAMLDQTERKQAQRALELAKERLEQTVEERTRERDQVWQATPDMLCVAGLDGFFHELNPAWSDTLGWSEAELRAQPFAELIHPDDRARTDHAMAALTRGEGVFGFENRYRTRAGGHRWFSWNALPRDGLIYAVVRDVTAAHEQAAALERAEEQLRQSQKMEAVGQLTGGLAHDFNNLLAGISGSLEMMGLRLTQGRVADLERYVSAAQGATRRAAALTHRLLAFSRRQTLTPSATDLNRLVGGMEELIQRTVGPEIAVETVGAAGLWTTLVDPNQLENALLNLAINARDAMPEGGRLTIETANRQMDERTARDRDLEPGHYVSLCVSDTGTGMAKEVIDRAFDPFFTTKPIGQGTGLGLSMIYGFARQSGGQVRIYSEVGAGTMVCIYLPRHLGEDEAGREDAGGVAAPAVVGAGETVLVVDDEPTVRMLVVDALEEMGYAALEAGDGATGLRLLQSGARIDLLVTDVGLPGGMNGRQLADAARALRPGLKVLFVTGYAENAVLNHGHLGAGMEVLTKPFAMEALGLRIRAMIEAR
jgi:PAS domain S-box-containing protein